MTSAARETFLASFIPDDPGLSQEERQRRAQAARRAHMLSLAARSAQVRRERTEALRTAAARAGDLAGELARLANEPL